MSRGKLARFALAVALFACVLLAPWWVSVLIACALSVRFRAWEVVVAGVLYDLVWLPAGASLISFDTIPFGTVVAVLLLVAFEPLRRQLLV